MISSEDTANACISCLYDIKAHIFIKNLHDDFNSIAANSEIRFKISVSIINIHQIKR